MEAPEGPRVETRLTFIRGHSLARHVEWDVEWERGNFSMRWRCRMALWEPLGAPKELQRPPEELLESQNGARRDPEELPRGSEELRKRS